MTTLLQLLRITAEFIGVVALADLIADAIHWVEDAYFTEDTPIIGPLFIRPNIVHHHFPRFFTKLSWWESSRDLFIFACLLVACAWWFNFLTWHI